LSNELTGEDVHYKFQIYERRFPYELQSTNVVATFAYLTCLCKRRARPKVAHSFSQETAIFLITKIYCVKKMALAFGGVFGQSEVAGIDFEVAGIASFSGRKRTFRPPEGVSGPVQILSWANEDP
jgi:hypothetical protein